MIEIKGLYKSFDDKTVLSDINASFENGKTNLIIGQSGSGKTVLMKCIVGLLTPEKGEVLYDGRNLVLMGKKEKKMLRKEMGMIFQSAALFDSMTVLDNVMFPLNMFSNDTLRERTKRAMFCLDRVNLGEAKDKFPGEISGGMQKRVAIARAIALNPQYLFCDEPNSGLDPKTSLVIDDLIHDITQEYNMTTIINTHDMNSVLGIGEKVIYIYEGHKEWEGTKDDIFTSTNERLNNFIFASDLLRKVKDVEVQGSGSGEASEAQTVPGTAVSCAEETKQGGSVEELVESGQLEQVQRLLNHVIGRAMEENCEKLSQDIAYMVHEKLLKEMDYLMRVADEKEDERFRQLDEMIRACQKDNQCRIEAAATKIPFLRFKKRKFGRNGNKL